MNIKNCILIHLRFSNKEKKGGPCVIPIKLFPPLYAIHALKHHKLLVAHDKMARGWSIIKKYIHALHLRRDRLKVSSIIKFEV